MYNMLRLSKRLEMIAEEVPPGSRLADIGSDHALLPIYLAERGAIVRGIAGEVNAGPRDAADRNVRAHGMAGLIDVRLGDGLSVVKAGEADVVTIAGMGGALIASILGQGLDKLSGVRRLVLQPNVGEFIVREWLYAHGWVLTGERILEEDGKIYEILTAVPEGDAPLTNSKLYRERRWPGEQAAAGRELLLKLGPYLTDQAPPVWAAKWERELDKLQMIADQLGNSNAEASQQKRTELLNEMEQIREVLRCSQKVKPSSN